ncbi:hypothetical protein SAMN02910358_00677 [Lachnospiraceae bacterium XBB1006]|nr:hypothetical protein SAMN02910358_00677 [Lachnospiraceae bacterium XBB1006]
MNIRERKKVDVICQHNADGTIIPIKIRLMTEDGEYQTYGIKGYRLLKGDNKQYSAPEFPFLPPGNTFYECRILTLDKMRTIVLYYHRESGTWTLCIP